MRNPFKKQPQQRVKYCHTHGCQLVYTTNPRGITFDEFTGKASRRVYYGYACPVRDCYQSVRNIWWEHYFIEQLPDYKAVCP